MERQTNRQSQTNTSLFVGGNDWDKVPLLCGFVDRAFDSMQSLGIISGDIMTFYR